MNYKTTALAVMRATPLHYGHCSIIDRMIHDHDNVIICLGSSDKSNTENNPFTYEQRLFMIKNVYGDRVNVLPLNDIGLTEVTDRWINYIINVISDNGLDIPTHCYSGSIIDSMWYKNYFGDNLYIMERSLNNIPSATDLRLMIRYDNNEWTKWIPKVNIDFVKNNFPTELMVCNNE